MTSPGAEVTLIRIVGVKDEAAKALPDDPKDLDDGIVYEVAFDGNDADAERLEKSTNLTLLGDDLHPYEEEVPCIATGKMTTRRQYLARMY